MIIDFKKIDGEVEDKVKVMAEGKLKKISTHLDAPGSEGRVTIEIRKEVGSRQHGEIWEAKARGEESTKTHYATASGSSAEIATSNAINELISEIRKTQGKEKTLRKRAGRMWKAMAQKIGR